MLGSSPAYGISNGSGPAVRGALPVGLLVGVSPHREAPFCMVFLASHEEKNYFQKLPILKAPLNFWTPASQDVSRRGIAALRHQR